MGRVDYGSNVFIGTRRFLCDTTLRRTSNENASLREFIDDFPAPPSPRRLVTAHATACAMAG